MIRVLLDGNVVTTPDGWEELRSKVKREDQYNAMLIYQETSLEFTADGYAYLYDKLLTEGFCYVASCEIQESCDDNTFTRLFIGKIFLSDVRFNERTCKATAKLEDNSFYAMIKNNRKIKTALDTNLSKNGVTITAANQYDIEFYDIGSNIFQLKLAVPSMTVYEAFKYLISFMSDNRVGFASSLFDIGGEWQGLAITTGQRIREDAYSAWQPISFEMLFEEVYKLVPIVMIIESPYNNPVIRIESEQYAYDSGYCATVSDLYEVVTSCKQDKLYSKVIVGSSNINDTSSLSFLEDINYFGFKKEEIFVEGECNIDNELDLLGDFVRSSNVIENQLTQQDNDDAIFFIDTELSTSTFGRTTNTNTFNLNPPLYYYNDRLRNSQVLTRWVGGIPNNVVKYIGVAGDGIFNASSTTLQTHDDVSSASTALVFDNVINNQGSYYDGTNKFTSLITGLYNFKLNVNYYINFGVAFEEAWADLKYKVYDSSNNLLKTVTLGSTYHISPNSVPYDTSGSFSLSTGNILLNENNYIKIFLEIIYITSPVLFNNTINLTPGSTFECLSNTVGGGLYQTYNPDDYPVLIHEFSYPISNTDWNGIVNNTIGRVAFGMNNSAFRSGWIDEITYNHITKIANFKLITSKSNAT